MRTAAARRPALAARTLARCATAVLLVHLLYSSRVAAESLEAVCKGELLMFSLPPIAVFDENGDAVIDERESAECDTLNMLFSRLDLDANGTLDPLEYDGFADLWTRHARTFGVDLPP